MKKLRDYLLPCMVWVIGMTAFSPNSLSADIFKMSESQAKTASFEASPEYRKAVAELMLAEANNLVERLKLPETEPITRDKLTELFVSPPNLAEVFGGPSGSIRTEKFSYAFAFKGKLSSLGRLDLFSHARLSDKELTDAYRKIAVTQSQIDTNMAWQAMQPYLKAGILDVEKLNRECQFHLKHLQWAELQVPIYSAKWSQEGGTVASLTLWMPDKILLSLRVEDPSFNLRPSFQMPAVKTNSVPVK